MARTIRLLALRYVVAGDGTDSWHEYEHTDEHGHAIPSTDELIDASELTIDEVADVLARHGCTTDEGAHWFYNVDGSYTVDYGIGLEEEPSAHLEGFSDRERERLSRILSER